MTATAIQPMDWEIRSDLPGRLRLTSETLRHSPALRRHCAHVCTACHWLHGFRLNGLAGSLSVRFPATRRQEVISLLALALAPPDDAPPDQSRSDPAASTPPHRQPLLLRHGALCAVALGLDLWLGLPALLINGAAAALTLPLLARAWRKLRRRPPHLTEALDVGFSCLLLRQGLGQEALLDQMLEDGSEMLRRLEEEEPRLLQRQDLLQRFGSQVRVRLAEGGDSLPLAAVPAGERLRLRPGTSVLLEMVLVEGSLGVIRPGEQGMWGPRPVVVGETLEPGWLVISGEGSGRVVRAFAEEGRFLFPPSHTPAPPEPPAIQKLLRLQNRLVEPLLLVLGGAWALGGSLERAMAAFQFNPLSDWQTSQRALRLATRADLRWHGIHLAHPQALVDLARLDRLLISPGCFNRLDRLAPKERLAKGADARPGDLLRLLACLERHLLHKSTLPDWYEEPEAGVEGWTPRRMTCSAERRGWEIELEDGRQLAVIPTRSTAAKQSVERLEVREGRKRLGSLTLERRADPVWQDVCEQLRRMGIEVVPMEAPASDGDDVSWRLDAVTTLQQQGLVVAWLGDDVSDIPAMTQADLALGLTFTENNLLPVSPFDVMLGEDPRWLPRLVGMSRELERASSTNLWMIGLTHILSTVATAGLAISPLQAVLLADLPMVLAECVNRRASGSHHRPLMARS